MNECEYVRYQSIEGEVIGTVFCAYYRELIWKTQIPPDVSITLEAFTVLDRNLDMHLAINRMFSTIRIQDRMIHIARAIVRHPIPSTIISMGTRACHLLAATKIGTP